MSWLSQSRESPKLVLGVVFVALLLDNMLFTVVVPILPMFLYSIEHPSPEPPTLGSALKSSRGHAQGPAPPLRRHSAPLLGPERNHNGSTSSLLSLFNNSTFNRQPAQDTAPLRSTEETQNHTLNSSRCLEDSEYLQKENIKVGSLLASKAVVQLLVNPFVGALTNRVGFHLPMFGGFLILFVSTLMFAFSRTYALLFVARSLQGIGSSFTAVSGLGMLASVYPNDEERGVAMGIALGGLALGVLSGAPFGSLMYEFVGNSAPFLILAGLALLDGVLQLWILRPAKLSPVSVEGTPILTLLKDPYIIISAGSLCFSNMAVAILEASLPIWMIQTMCAPQWQLGTAFLPASVSYLISTNLFGILANKLGRWLCSMLGMFMVGVSLICVPFASSLYTLIGPNAVLGIGLGMVDTSVMAVMAHLVDIRHTSVYGSIYAIADVALCLGFAIGPLTAGALVLAVGFPVLMVVIAVVNILYAPLCFLLRSPPVQEETRAILDQESSVHRSDRLDLRQFPLSDFSGDE